MQNASNNNSIFDQNAMTNTSIFQRSIPGHDIALDTQYQPLDQIDEGIMVKLKQSCQFKA